MDFPIGSVVKNLHAMQEPQKMLVPFLRWEDLVEEGIATLSFLPGESQGQRSLVGCHPWGHTQSETTEAT